MNSATLERAARSGPCPAPAARCVVATALQEESFLNTLLPYALAQSQRHREPLSLFCMAIDRLGAIRELLGRDVAVEAVRRVGATVIRTLRTADIVARLEDDRLAALLPGASHADALVVAEAIRSAVAEVGLGSPTMPLLTISIGAASFPNHAADSPSLLAAAAAALAEARRRGHNRISSVPENTPRFPETVAFLFSETSLPT